MGRRGRQAPFRAYALSGNGQDEKVTEKAWAQRVTTRP